MGLSNGKIVDHVEHVNRAGFLMVFCVEFRNFSNAIGSVFRSCWQQFL